MEAAGTTPHSPHWRRNQIAITVASFIGFTSFTLVMPFLPLYFEELGLHDTSAIAIWSGLSLGVTPAITAAIAPIWARIADRFGRKLMVVRSLTFFTTSMVLMAFVTHPWQVFGLRAVLGLFAGYGPIAITMAAESAPPAEMASALGWVQTAQRLGPAIGPVLGGLLAHTVGLRHAFFVAAGFYAFALMLIVLGYRERPRHTDQVTESDRGRVTFRSLRLVPHFVLIMLIIFGLQLVDRSFGPILPLYLREIGIAESRVSFMSGIVFTVAAGAAAIGNQTAGWLLKRRGAREMIVWSAVLASIAAAILGIGPATALLLGSAVMFGLGIGVATTTLYAAAGGAVPASARGVAFGYLSTAYLMGLAISPVVAGFIGAQSMRAIFLLDAAGLIAIASVVGLRMKPSAAARH